jgi:hypothetical protein
MTDDGERAAIDLKIARADAIHNYAALEQSLCTLFGRLLGTTDPLAGIVFFRIVATRSRNDMIEALLEKRFGEQYDIYWHGVPGSPGVLKQTGLLALIKQLDTTRNFIVHWAIAVHIGDGPATQSLIPPNIWNYVDDRRSLTVADLQEFSKKASFVARSLNMFNFWIFDAPTRKMEIEEAWREIFQQPCTYPPSSTHPLYSTP